MTSGYRRRLTIHGTGQEGTIMSVEFDEDTGTLLDGKNFATVATLNEDGSPHTSVVWITRDGNTVLFTTTAGSRKGRNLARDPRISLTVIDAQNPYHSVDIRGATELTEDRDKSLPRRLSHKYLAADRPRARSPVDRPGHTAESHWILPTPRESGGRPGTSAIIRVSS
jgi:PPOX class probable F420-dependent enzyme